MEVEQQSLDENIDRRRQRRALRASVVALRAPRFKSLYKHHRFPPEIIQHAVWLYYFFNLSGRDVEDLLAERGIAVSYESIRLWCIKVGTEFAKRLRRRHQGYGDTFFIDEVFVRI